MIGTDQQQFTHQIKSLYIKNIATLIMPNFFYVMHNLITILMKKERKSWKQWTLCIKTEEQQTTEVCIHTYNSWLNMATSPFVVTYKIMIHRNIMPLRTENFNSICYMTHSQLLQNVSSPSLTYITFYMESVCMIFKQAYRPNDDSTYELKYVAHCM